jgi:hypothetical protein
VIVEDCDEDIKVEDPRCSGIMNNRNHNLLRPENIVQGVQERIVFVQPELKLSMEKSTQCQPIE